MIILDINQVAHADDAFQSLGTAAQQAQQKLKILDNQLLRLRVNFSQLRGAMERCFAPIAAAVLPLLNGVIRDLIRFCDDAGTVLAALFGTVYKKAVTTTRKTGSAIRRTLASFDELQRLGGGSGGGGATETSVTLEPVNDALTPQLAAVAQKIRDTVTAVTEKIRSLVEPLKQIDFSQSIAAFRGFCQVVADLGAALLTHLEWAWFHILVPLGKWTIESAAPNAVNVLTAALGLLQRTLQPLWETFRQLKPVLDPLVAFLGQTLVGAFSAVGNQIVAMGELLNLRLPQFKTLILSLAEPVNALMAQLVPLVNWLSQLWNSVLGSMSTAVAEWTGFLVTQLTGLTEFITGVLTGDWSRAWTGLKNALKSAVNGIIALLNGMISGLASGLNAISTALNKWRITVPQWVPGVGGKTFAFNLGKVTAPQIPYLAKGAVLPAGKPFLAVVGDQHHGTNIEAPLSTIQEAVALAMEDMAAGNLAGHQATVDLLGQILQAVLGIRIGDDMIAAACQRSLSRQAVMKGGAYAL